MSVTAIYWFSGTGNSLAVGRMLADDLPDTTLISIADAIHSPREPADTVGVVFPVYWFGLPNLVDSFLKTVPLASEPYVFTVATMAMMPGAAHQQAKKVLEQRGIALAAGWSVRMPENYSPVPAERSKVKPEGLFEKAATATAAIARQVVERKRGSIQDSIFPVSLMGGALHRLMAPRFARADKTFVVEDHCTSCGTCVRVCPVSNIVLSAEGLPQWQHHCEQCFACMQWCPVNAIRAERFPANRRRYQHPDIKIEDLAAATAESSNDATDESSPAPPPAQAEE